MGCVSDNYKISVCRILILAVLCISWNIFFFAGISLVDEQTGQSDEKPGLSNIGVRHAYTLPKSAHATSSETEQIVPESEGPSLAELMAEMKSI